MYIYIYKILLDRRFQRTQERQRGLGEDKD